MDRVIPYRRRGPAPKRRETSRADLLIALIVGVFSFLAVLWMKPLAETEAAPLAGLAGSARVIDGDTFDIHTRNGPVRVRLDGVDAFEARQRCGGASCGAEAGRALDRLIDGRPVVCVERGRDRYDRTLARCRVGDRDIGGWMVENGHAVAYRRYSHAYLAHELRARHAGAGAWVTGFENPEDWRHAR